MSVALKPVKACYAARHLNEDVRMRSRSGGAFSAIAEAFLESGGVVYGVRMANVRVAEYCRIDSIDQIDAIRGSKYIQADKRTSFESVADDLKHGTKVLFSGVSCELAGLLGYLARRSIDTSNLFCVDVLCNSVPSPGLWASYIDYIEKSASSKVSSVQFRDKLRFGWRSHRESYEVKGRVIGDDVFARMFNSHHSVRPSCFACPFKSGMRIGDITVGDFWGIENVAPELDDNKGVSLVLVYSEKGESLISSARSSMLLTAVSSCDALVQKPFYEPPTPPVDRMRFWSGFANYGFMWVAKRYGGKSKLHALLRRAYQHGLALRGILDASSEKNVFTNNGVEPRAAVLLFGNKNECCGCTACFAVCPKHAISMLFDDEGFLYPHVDENLCVECGQCADVCGFSEMLALKSCNTGEEE